jgi:hypothetical protein
VQRLADWRDSLEAGPGLFWRARAKGSLSSATGHGAKHPSSDIGTYWRTRRFVPSVGQFRTAERSCPAERQEAGASRFSLAIGAATFVMSTGGMLAGRLIGMRFGRWAEIVGGLALFGLGLSILVDHLTS